jgi:hypothetical protein
MSLAIGDIGYGCAIVDVEARNTLEEFIVTTAMGCT